MISNRVIRYLIVGGTAYLFEMATLYGVHHILGLSPLRSVAISFWAGFIVAFVLQKLVAFQNYERRAHLVVAQLAGYSLLVAWNYLVTLAAVKILANVASVFIIRTGVIIIVTMWNFAVYRYLFRIADD